MISILHSTQGVINMIQINTHKHWRLRGSRFLCPLSLEKTLRESYHRLRNILNLDMKGLKLKQILSCTSTTSSVL